MSRPGSRSSRRLLAKSIPFEVPKERLQRLLKRWARTGLCGEQYNVGRTGLSTIRCCRLRFAIVWLFSRPGTAVGVLGRPRPSKSRVDEVLEMCVSVERRLGDMGIQVASLPHVMTGWITASVVRSRARWKSRCRRSCLVLLVCRCVLAMRKSCAERVQAWQEPRGTALRSPSADRKNDHGAGLHACRSVHVGSIAMSILRRAAVLS